MTHKPKISILMSVYNCSNVLKHSINSILNQDFSNFEFLIMNDGSTDESHEILNNYLKLDERIQLFHNSTNLGLTKSLNLLLRESTAKYIARQDADDVSLTNRFSRQLDVLESQNYDICVSRAVKKNSKKLIPNISYWVPKKILFKFKNPYIHGTLIAKRKVFEKVNGYDEKFYYSQDYKFFSDCYKQNFKIKYLNEPLYILNTKGNISSKNYFEQKKFADLVKSEYKIYENLFK
jgi:glycosyltransferase involved in cell wall biosynthesis